MNSLEQIVRKSIRPFEPICIMRRSVLMRRLWAILLFGISLSAAAQTGSRWFFTLGPSVTTGNSFVGGQQSISAPDITGSHSIHTMFSPLWGYPNPQYSGAQNLGRKLHLGFQYERYFSRHFALVTGLELGARGYIIQSEFSNDLLVSYRAVTVPLYASFSPFKGNRFWTFRQNIGMQLMYASSVPERVAGNIELVRNRNLSPQLYAGLELIHNSFSAPFGFEVGYSHGFSNVIDHYYLGLDYRTPIKIESTGSAFHFKIKYLLKEKRDPLKEKLVHKKLDQYDLLAFRNVKDPILIKTAFDTIHVCVEDDQTIDGDSIAIEFNQRIIQRDIMIQREPLCFDIITTASGTNTFIVHALNEGKIPPNTCVIHLYFGDEHREVRLKSDMKNSGAIRFQH